jgi:hypothetical protein
MISRALYALGCSRDFYRIDRFIQGFYFDRPLNGEKSKALWIALPHDALYIEWMAENINKTLQCGWDQGVPSKFLENLLAVIGKCDGLDKMVSAKGIKIVKIPGFKSPLVEVQDEVQVAPGNFQQSAQQENYEELVQEEELVQDEETEQEEELADHFGDMTVQEDANVDHNSS